MSNLLTRLAVRTLLLAVALATALPLVSVAQETAEPAPSEAPAAGAGDPAAPLAVPASPVPGPDTATPILPTPSLSPGPKPLPSRDWRSVGYASVVDGKLYDPFCRPLRSVGSNVPNLLLREGLRENLEWMRQHQMRWLRVIATGHGTLLPKDQINIGTVEQRLAGFLREVEAFNASHPPREAIYAIVNFADYYEPGIPGDRYGFDHAGWCDSRVLNAPWYRRGVQRYSFDQA